MIVRNFVTGYPWWKKIVVNFLNILAEVPVSFANNALTRRDYKLAKWTIKKGDVLLLGSHRKLSKYFVAGPLTHSMLCVGRGKFVHSAADGVERISLKQVFRTYDAMVVLRLKNRRRRDVAAAVNYVKKQLGKPYNFEFQHGETDGFYCSELVYFALEQAGVDVGRFVGGQQYYVPEAAFNVEVHPMHYLGGEFRVIAHSENLRLEDGRLELLD